jgi:hypothetical protein
LIGYTDPSLPQQNDVDNTMRNCKIIESILRAESNLDEQLHAGSYFYYPTGDTTFQSSNVYMYPIALALIGYGIPISLLFPHPFCVSVMTP